MNKPLLFLFSSAVQLANVYYLKDVGAVLNLLEAPVDAVMQYEKKDFIICDMKNQDQVDKLKFIDLDKCITVAVLRAHESVDEPWIKRLNPLYKVKSFDWVDDCRSKNEILNTIKVKSVFKKPDGDISFWMKKLSFLLRCFRDNL